MDLHSISSAQPSKKSRFLQGSRQRISGTEYAEEEQYVIAPIRKLGAQHDSSHRNPQAALLIKGTDQRRSRTETAVFGTLDADCDSTGEELS